MRFADKEAKTTLTINEHVCLSGIPEEAQRYVVNGRTPLEWFIDRYKIKKDTDSGIINDPNGWVPEPPRPHHRHRAHRPHQRRVHQTHRESTIQAD